MDMQDAFNFSHKLQTTTSYIVSFPDHFRRHFVKDAEDGGWK